MTGVGSRDSASEKAADCSEKAREEEELVIGNDHRNEMMIRRWEFLIS